MGRGWGEGGERKGIEKSNERRGVREEEEWTEEEKEGRNKYRRMGVEKNRRGGKGEGSKEKVDREEGEGIKGDSNLHDEVQEALVQLIFNMSTVNCHGRWLVEHKQKNSLSRQCIT